LTLTWREIARHPLILPFYVPALIVSFSLGLLIPVLPLYAKGLDASYGLIGLVLAGEGLGTLISDVPSGMLLRRLGQRASMLLGLGCMALSTVALFGADTILAALACRMVSGFGMALYGVARHAYVADHAAVAQRGRVLALFGGMFRIGRFVGPVLGGLVAQRYGLRAAFLAFGITHAAAIAVIASCVHRGPARSAQAKGAEVRGGRLFYALKSRAGVLAPAGAAQLFAQMIRAGRTSILPLYAADVIGLDVQQIGLILSISSAVDTAMFLPAGWIMDHLGRKSAIVPCFTIQAVGMFLVPFTGSITGLLLVSCLIGLGNGLGSGSMMTLGADLSPPEARGEFLGVWRLIGDGGASGGPLVVGGVADLVALPTAAWAMAAAGLAAGVIFFFFVPETLKKRRSVQVVVCDGGEGSTRAKIP
jgi:MFS family permease